MPKENKPKIEEETVKSLKTPKEAPEIDPEQQSLTADNLFKTLTAAPDKLMRPLMVIHARVTAALQRVQSTAQQKYLVKTADLIADYAVRLNNEYVEPPAKSLEDAEKYAMSRSFDGTYIALLDENQNLVKTVLVAKNEVWRTMPPIELCERNVELTMAAKFLVIDGTDFGVTDANPNGGKSIPKRVVSAVPFGCNRVKILKYAEAAEQ